MEMAPSTHLTGVVQISAGNGFSCALKNSGNVYCWGAGTYGKLGNDATTNKDHPVHVVRTNGDSSSMLSDVVQIGAAHSHTCALESTGKIFCWGRGDGGRLGNNDLTAHSVDHPISVVASASNTTPHVLGNDVLCTTDANGIETCNLPPDLPAFTTGQATEDGSDSISIDLDASESLAALSFYSDQYCTQALDHTSNANPAIIRNLPLGEHHIYFKRGARSLCYDSELILSERFVSNSPYQTKNYCRIRTHLRARLILGGVLCWGAWILWKTRQ